MPERRPGEEKIEDLLREAGSSIEYPPTPDVAHAARMRLEREADSAAHRSRPLVPALRWAAAAVLVVLLAVPVLSPAARDGLSGWLATGQSANNGASGGSETGGLPESAAPASRDRTPEVPGLGGTTLQEARERLGSPVLLPRRRGLGEPDGVYGAGESIVLAYGERPGLPGLGATGAGLLIAERNEDLEAAYPDFSEGERVRVGGSRGYWFPDGTQVRPQVGETGALPGGALLWESRGKVVLLRADLPKSEAVKLAGTVR